MIAAIGKQLKQSVKVFHSLILYRRLPFSHTLARVSTNIERPTFVVKPVDSVDTRALVVSSQDEEVFGIFDLVS
jgi:hypothetical protein